MQTIQAGRRRPLFFGLALTVALAGAARSQDGAKPAEGVPPAAQPEAPKAATAHAPAPDDDDAPADLSVLLNRYAPDAPKAAPTPPAGSNRAIVNSLFDGDVKQAGCATCGGQGPRLGGTCGSCGSLGGARCVPGRGKCPPLDSDSFYARVFGNLYECLCCPDPCYQPSWIPAANASFFTDYARPRTVTRLRYDRGYNMQFPDRNEYFWAKQNLANNLMTVAGRPILRNVGSGKGPSFPPTQVKGRPVPSPLRRGGIFGETGLNYDQLYLYQEAASTNGSLFIEQSYRSFYPDITPHQAGFGDLNFGTKALLVDCELMQLTFQFKTYTPTAQAKRGFGTGHFSLEPSLLLSVRLAEDTYFQGQIAEWIPLGGDQNYAGALIKYNFSVNHVLAYTAPDSPLIGTLEFTGLTFQNGLYTDPFRGPRNSRGGTYASFGPGLRHSLCDRVDYGGAIAWQVSDAGRFASPLLRLEVRVLY